MPVFDLCVTGQQSNESDVARIEGFVRRARRIALHPIVQDEEGLRRLLAVETKVNVTVHPDGKEVYEWKREVPDEVLFESLVARVRPFLVGSDFMSYSKILASLERLAVPDDDDVALRISHKQVKEAWVEATQRKNATRAYRMQIFDAEGNELAAPTDLDLAYAWLYEDSVHGDQQKVMAGIGIDDRYEAAVGVFSHVAVAALETLHFVNELVELGVLSLNPGAFYQRVTVGTLELVTTGEAFVADGPGEDKPLTGVEQPEGFRSLHQHVTELRAAADD